MHIKVIKERTRLFGLATKQLFFYPLKRRVIMFDIDGVMRDFDTAWRKVWTRHFGAPPVVKDGTQWDTIGQAAKHIGLSSEKANELIFVTYGHYIMSTAKPYAQAIEAVNMFYDRGWTVVLASDQNTPQIQAGTMTWLKRHRISHDLLVWAGNKAVIRADIYVEDKPSNLRALAERYPKARVFRVVQPWNVTMDEFYPFFETVVARAPRFFNLHHIDSIYNLPPILEHFGLW